MPDLEAAQNHARPAWSMDIKQKFASSCVGSPDKKDMIYYIFFERALPVARGRKNSGDPARLLANRIAHRNIEHEISRP